MGDEPRVVSATDQAFRRLIDANFTPKQQRALARIAQLVEQGLATWGGK